MSQLGGEGDVRAAKWGLRVHWRLEIGEVLKKAEWGVGRTQRERGTKGLGSWATQRGGPAAQLRGGYPGRDKLGPSALELHRLDLSAESIL